VSGVQVSPWSGPRPATEEAVELKAASEGLSGYRWSNGPGDEYAAHAHGYHKVIYVLRGSITFGLPDAGETIDLSAGDRLDLPAGTRHDAIVGPQGVVCFEAHL
jgi:quercetin dioxygenase-like cupin family protein